MWKRRFKNDFTWNISKLIESTKRSRYMCRKYYLLFNKNWDATHRFLKEIEGKNKVEIETILEKWLKALKIVRR